jgi:hypothetical protein
MGPEVDVWALGAMIRALLLGADDPSLLQMWDGQNVANIGRWAKWMPEHIPAVSEGMYTFHGY